jgi:hypothetical protein
LNRVSLEVVDQEWAQDKLPDEGILHCRLVFYFLVWRVVIITGTFFCFLDAMVSSQTLDAAMMGVPSEHLVSTETSLRMIILLTLRFANGLEQPEPPKSKETWNDLGLEDFV